MSAAWDGRRLAEAREARGLTQGEVAESIGVHRQYVSAIERDERTPGADLLVALARALDVTTDALLGLSPLPTSVVPVETGSQAFERFAETCPMGPHDGERWPCEACGWVPDSEGQEPASRDYRSHPGPGRVVQAVRPVLLR